MTREQAKKLLPVITAFANGKQIQMKVSNSLNEWKDFPNLDFHADPSLYRIKLESREFWLVNDRSGKLLTILYSEPNSLFKSKHSDCEIIHVKEVIE